MRVTWGLGVHVTNFKSEVNFCNSLQGSYVLPSKSKNELWLGIFEFRKQNYPMNSFDLSVAHFGLGNI